MRGKGLLAAFLLTAGLCLVPALGYGEVKKWMDREKVSLMDISLLTARIDYIMQNPNDFLDVMLYYDRTGMFGREFFPETVDTKGKIVVQIEDTRDLFACEPELLIIPFTLELNSIYISTLELVATDRDSDIVAVFYRGGKELGYFYQGEYHLWGD